MRAKWQRRHCALVVGFFGGLIAGCSIGPQALQNSRLRYNQVVKVTSEEQLLLNIVRLRYTDTPSSLGVTTIAAQHEFVKSLKLIPFFVASGDAAPRSFTGLLPQAELNAADRPTISLTPQDDLEFTRRLFTPLPQDGIISLSKTTWPISTVFRLWLENINWVSNAETGSGPTPRDPPIYADFVQGMHVLQRLQDRKIIAFFTDEQEETITKDVPAQRLSAQDVTEAAKAGMEYRRDEKGETWTLLKKKPRALLKINPNCLDDPDILEFCRLFKLKPGLNSYDLVADKLDPFFQNKNPEGLNILDLESRSLLQVLYFISHGIEIPPEHMANGIVPLTLEPDGRVFDWNQVLGGLFKVSFASGKHPPQCAHVAVCYAGYWFYIDERDRDSKSTFSLLMELSRLELTSKAGGAPVLTIPLGR